MNTKVHDFLGKRQKMKKLFENIDTDALGFDIAAVAVLLLLAFFLFYIIRTVATTRRDNAKRLKEIEDEPDTPPELCEVCATVIGKRCDVSARGTKTVFVKKNFYLGFRTEDGRDLIFPVEEAMYLEVEEGQKGTLATLNGNYYGFYVEEE